MKTIICRGKSFSSRKELKALVSVHINCLNCSQNYDCCLGKFSTLSFYQIKAAVFKVIVLGNDSLGYKSLKSHERSAHKINYF